MNERIAQISAHLHKLELELEAELAKRRIELAFDVKGRVVQFEEHVLHRHRKLKTPLAHYVFHSRPLMVITAPVIYSLIVPFVLLDIFVTLYQRICFPIYGIARVSRRDHLIFDRGQLAYLNAIEKLNCAYCSYANGAIDYVREVASRTEQYWCPIKHARRVIGAHERSRHFVDYGDALAYRIELGRLREELRQPGVPDAAPPGP